MAVEPTEAGRDGTGARPSTRRRKRVEGGRRHRHEVKVTPEEEGQLLALALRYRVSVPKLLIDSALAGGAANAAANASVRDELLTELFKAYRVLAGIANNVNQIARATNATGEAQAETSATLAAVRRTAERIDGLIDQLAEALR
ncbi:mobilization protein [Intrasporangium chromatireducens Q5-1]|uniref:Mobilization protein n=1 Tax=Intrasporangium chromatireducens Q5-1 TaxID=584657 RepID=W9GN15_9MICO|nr:MobC family plasmid mobilization relaxosome protein [Intrasporangium chromatireducens]EWT06218.1 mobilization protein [Intrasporangium chromatireducens Q5-1]